MADRLIFIRHGMRADFEDPNWYKNAPRPHDPPLTRSGMQQAEETADFLGNTSIRHLFASPFYRTMQTAHVIARTLHLTIKVEHGFSEWLNPAWFDSAPDILNLVQLSKHFSNLDQGYESIAYPEFPETIENKGVLNRVKKTLGEIINEYNETVAIVGHGATIHAAEQILFDKSNGMDGGLCSVNILSLNHGKWELDYASNEHLQTREKKFDNRLK